jgi:hypothetical protein
MQVSVFDIVILMQRYEQHKVCSQIFELWHIFKGFIIWRYNVQGRNSCMQFSKLNFTETKSTNVCLARSSYVSSSLSTATNHIRFLSEDRKLPYGKLYESEGEMEVRHQIKPQYEIILLCQQW